MTSFNLVRHSLNNVDDVAGRWQHEGGEVFTKTKELATTQAPKE
jgi:hypothetical protein